MLVVDRPMFPPGQCVVNLSSSDRRGFLDLGDRTLVDPRVYVSYQAVVDMGRAFGLPSPDEFVRLQLQASVQASRIERLEDEVRQLNRDVEAAEWTLERKFQAKVQAKPGRPRKVEA